MHHFFISEEKILGEEIRMDDPADLKHARALHLKEGERLLFSDGAGMDYLCVLERFSKEELLARIEERRPNETEPAVAVSLFQGIPKGSKMEDIVQKCVELGVHDIVPVFMERTVVEDRGQYDRKVRRLNAVAEAAAKQSGRGRIPEVGEAISFGELSAALSDYETILFLYEGEKEESLKAALRGETPPESLALVVGPEGGFDPAEAEVLQALPGCRCVSLGRRILRTETAGMAVLAMLFYEWEQ